MRRVPKDPALHAIAVLSLKPLFDDGRLWGLPTREEHDRHHESEGHRTGHHVEDGLRRLREGDLDVLEDLLGLLAGVSAEVAGAGAAAGLGERLDRKSVV